MQQIAVMPCLTLATVFRCASMLCVLLLIAVVPILALLAVRPLRCRLIQRSLNPLIEPFSNVLLCCCGCGSPWANCCGSPPPSTLLLHSVALLPALCAGIQAIVLLIR